MLMGFDKFGMPEKPVLTLAYPQGNELGQIGSYMDFNFDPVFRSYSSISFKFPYSKEKEDLYNKTCNQMRIKTEELGEFIIASCEEENTGTEQYKQITANSSEVQMCRRKVNLLNGTYRFWGNSQSENDESLLGKLICDYLPTWTIGEISADLKNKWRTFDVPDATLYDFLMNEVSEAYECIFVFDTIGRKINAYTTEEAVHDSDIYVGYGNFLKSEKIEEISEEITTVMSCYGGEGVNIASVNPLGSVFLYNFDHFKPMMSESLSHHLDFWELTVRGKKEEYARYVTYIKENNRELIKLKADLRDLESMLAALEDVQAVRVANGQSKAETDTNIVEFDENNQITNAEELKYVVLMAAIHAIKGEKGSTEVIIKTPDSTGTLNNIAPTKATITHPDNTKEILEVEKNITSVKDAIAKLEQAILYVETEKRDINNLLKLEPAEATGLRDENGEGFTADDLLELDYFKFESTHQDENYIITDTMDFDRQQDMIQDFYDSCVSLMKNISAPTYNITADTINFLFVEKIAPYVLKTYDPNKPDTLKQLLGVKFHLEIAPDEWIDPVLLKFHVNFDNPSDFSMEFSNKYRLNSAIWTYADLIGDAVSSSGSMSFDYSSVKNWATHKDEMLDFINGNLDVSKNRLINSSENNDFLIDNTGIRGSSTAKSGGDTNKGIWITADTIAFTTDNWESARTAIGLIGDTGGYGVNAEVLIGKAIFGSNLMISNEANTMTMDNRGLIIQSNSGTISLIPNKNLEGENDNPGGISIINNQGTNVFQVNMDGELVLQSINAKSGKIGGFTITTERINNTDVAVLKSTESTSNPRIVLRSNGTATIGMMEVGKTSTTFNGNIYARNILYGEQIINGERVDFGTLDGGAITGNSITANEIKYATITANEIAGSTITTQELDLDGDYGVQKYFDGIYATSATVETLITNKGYITEADVGDLIAKRIKSGNFTIDEGKTLAWSTGCSLTSYVSVGKELVLTVSNTLKTTTVRCTNLYINNILVRKAASPGQVPSDGYVLYIE